MNQLGFGGKNRKFLRVRYEGARTFPRLAAAFVDLFYVAIFTALLNFLMKPFVASIIPKEFHAWEKYLLFVFTVLAFHHLFYAPILEISARTPGKSALNLKILNYEDRSNPSLSQNLTRGALRLVFLIPFLAGILVHQKIYIAGGFVFMFIPYLWHFFDRERQTIFDIWTGVIVLERISEPSQKDAETLLREEVNHYWADLPEEKRQSVDN